MYTVSDIKTEAAAVAELVSQIGQPITGATTHPFIMKPNGELASLEPFQATPYRITAAEIFYDMTSFMEYVHRFKTPDTLMFESENGLVARLDYHSNGHPSWNTHKATLLFKHDDTFTSWLARDGKYFAQADFAEFLELSTRGIVTPPAAEIIEVARTLVANKNVNYRSGVRTQNGDVQLKYDEDTQAKAGTTGELSIPEVFTLALPVYQGCEPSKIIVRLFWRISDGDHKLTFRTQIMNKIQIIEDARQLIRDEIELALKMVILR